jgi:hypothetical protein
MAGAGSKLFVAGDVLTAGQVNTYLMDQTVMRFADEAARTAAFGGSGEAVLAEGMVSYLMDTNVVQAYDGTEWKSISSGGDSDQVVLGTRLFS